MKLYLGLLLIAAVFAMQITANVAQNSGSSEAPAGGSPGSSEAPAGGSPGSSEAPAGGSPGSSKAPAAGSSGSSEAPAGGSSGSSGSGGSTPVVNSAGLPSVSLPLKLMFLAIGAFYLCKN